MAELCAHHGDSDIEVLTYSISGPHHHYHQHPHQPCHFHHQHHYQLLILASEKVSILLKTQPNQDIYTYRYIDIVTKSSVAIQIQSFIVPPASELVI